MEEELKTAVRNEFSLRVVVSCTWKYSLFEVKFEKQQKNRNASSFTMYVAMYLADTSLLGQMIHVRWALVRTLDLFPHRTEPTAQYSN